MEKDLYEKKVVMYNGHTASVREIKNGMCALVYWARGFTQEIVITVYIPREEWHRIKQHPDYN